MFTTRDIDKTNSEGRLPFGAVDQWQHTPRHSPSMSVIDKSRHQHAGSYPNTEFALHAELPVLSDFAIGFCRHFLSDENWCHLGFDIPETGSPIVNSHSTPLEMFFKQHQNSLSTVVISRPLPPAMTCKHTTIQIDKGRLEHIWTSLSRGFSI